VGEAPLIPVADGLAEAEADGLGLGEGVAAGLAEPEADAAAVGTQLGCGVGASKV
jgi:hypothetical protein